MADYTWFRLRSSRRRGLPISDVAHISFSFFPRVLLYIFYRSLSSHARSQTFLSLPSFFSLLYFPSFFLLYTPRLSLTLHLSPSPICRPVYLSVSLWHPLRRVVYLLLSLSLSNFSLFLSSACLPSSGRTDRSCSWLSCPLHGLQDGVRGRSLLLCSDRCGDQRVEEREGKREKERETTTPKHEREESDRYDYYSRAE